MRLILGMLKFIFIRTYDIINPPNVTCFFMSLFIRAILCVSVDLPKVEGFVALNTTDNSTVLNWTRVAGASGYRLSWRHISGQ